MSVLHSLSPIMPSADLDRSARFYRDLGFAPLYQDASYLLMTRDTAEVHFFFHAAHRPEESDHGAYLRPDDVDAFSAEVAALGLPAEAGFPRFSPAEDKPWGMREATIWDPDGNLLRAGQEVSHG
ncbi:MAG: VOC family protein [Pseudomonadota bacterium]